MLFFCFVLLFKPITILKFYYHTQKWMQKHLQKMKSSKYKQLSFTYRNKYPHISFTVTIKDSVLIWECTTGQEKMETILGFNVLDCWPVEKKRDITGCQPRLQGAVKAVFHQIFCCEDNKQYPLLVGLISFLSSLEVVVVLKLFTACIIFTQMQLHSCCLSVLVLRTAELKQLFFKISISNSITTVNRQMCLYLL